MSVFEGLCADYVDAVEDYYQRPTLEGLDDCLDAARALLRAVLDEEGFFDVDVVM